MDRYPPAQLRPAIQSHMLAPCTGRRTLCLRTDLLQARGQVHRRGLGKEHDGLVEACAQQVGAQLPQDGDADVQWQRRRAHEQLVKQREDFVEREDVCCAAPPGAMKSAPRSGVPGRVGQAAGPRQRPRPRVVPKAGPRGAHV